MGPTIDSRIKTPDAMIQLIHTKYEVGALEHKSSTQLNVVM
jgi:hypothetical protein